MTKRLSLAALRAALLPGGATCAVRLFPATATAQVFTEGDDSSCVQKMKANGYLFYNGQGLAGLPPNFAGQESTLGQRTEQRLVPASAVADAFVTVSPTAPAGVYLVTVSNGAHVRTTRWLREPSCAGATTISQPKAY